MPRAFPPLRLLTVFDAVSRSGSTQKAAGDLNVTQPAVSQALKSLEDYVGVRLFDRTTRPATLTPADNCFTKGDGRIGQDRRLDRRVRSLRAVAENSVTIACTVGTATYWLMPRLAGFHAKHPDIAVNVLTTATLLHVVNADSNWLTWKEYFEKSGLPENRSLGRNFTNYVQATQAALSGQGAMLGWKSNTGDLVREGRLKALDGADFFPKDAFYLEARVLKRAEGRRPGVREVGGGDGRSESCVIGAGERRQCDRPRFA